MRTQTDANIDLYVPLDCAHPILVHNMIGIGLVCIMGDHHCLDFVFIKNDISDFPNRTIVQAPGGIEIFPQVKQ